MFMLGLGPIALVHNRTDTSSSAREIASDYWCRPIIDRLLYYPGLYFYSNIFSMVFNYLSMSKNGPDYRYMLHYVYNLINVYST